MTGIPYEDYYGESYSPEEVFHGCLDDCVPLIGDLATAGRSLVVGCGASSFYDFLQPKGILMQCLRRLTLHGVHSITAVDVGDSVGYDCFSNGDKVRISDKAMSGVTARDLQLDSDACDIMDIIAPIYLRRDAICGGLMIDIRGAINLQVILVRSESASTLFKRLQGFDLAPDTLSQLAARSIRKGRVRVLHYISFENSHTRFNDEIFAESRLLRVTAGTCSNSQLAGVVAVHDVQNALRRRVRLEKDNNLPVKMVQLEGLVQEMTTAAKRVRKARVAAEDLLADKKQIINSLPAPASTSTMDTADAKLEANHQVVADFWGHFQDVSSLQSKLINSRRKGLVRRGSAARGHVLTLTPEISEMIDDIVCFVCERAIAMGEGAASKDESYAWFDIFGSSKKMRASDTWAQPLRVQIVHAYPRITIEYPDETFLGSDEEEDALRGPVLSSGADASASKSSPVVSSASSDPTLRKLNITKKHDSDEADKKYLMAVYDSTSLVQDVTKYLKAGTTMMKHGRIGSPHDRLFWVALVANKPTLLWVDPEKRSSSAKTTIPLADISSVVLGPFSKVFKRHAVTNQSKDFFLSFTLHLCDDSRTVDIVAPTLPDFEAWVLGICHAAQVDPYFGKKLKLPKDDFSHRLTEQERALCEDWYIFPQAFVAVKDRIVTLRNEVQQHLRIFGNNAEQAFVALGGIHLPQVNSKGAILMTKGELRHHCTPYNIDIFRVCEMWQLFSDQNLIYDLSYVPATHFGIRQRKAAHN